VRVRLGSIAFLLGSAATGITWLTLQPSVLRLIDSVRRLAPEGSADAEMLGRVRGLLPFYLALDLGLITALCFIVLFLMVGRPIRRTEEAIDQLARLELESPLKASGGPLLARVQTSLRRMADALREEQALTRRQLTQLQSTNAQLVQAQTELVAAERLATVGRLAAGVAHEVGNPLSGILGYLSYARSRSTITPDLKDLLDRIDSEVQRINQIVRSLLDLGRAPKGKPVPVEIAPLVESCVKLLAAGPEFSDVKVELDVPAGTMVRAEPGPLSQVFINLLLNASQAMGGKGQVTVRARRQDEWCEIDVEDTGPGIPPDVLPRVFEPFFTTKTAEKGTGLGLAVSKHLISTVGGELTAHSKPAGACFTLKLLAASH
jgi:signal transduction histidine kinase